MLYIPFFSRRIFAKTLSTYIPRFHIKWNIGVHKNRYVQNCYSYLPIFIVCTYYLIRLSVRLNLVTASGSAHKVVLKVLNSFVHISVLTPRLMEINRFVYWEFSRNRSRNAEQLSNIHTLLYSVGFQPKMAPKVRLVMD